MNGYNAQIKNGWITFIGDDGEESSFHKDSVVMVKLSTTQENSRLMIETAGSSRVQVHYLKDAGEAQYIRTLILGE